MKKSSCLLLLTVVLSSTAWAACKPPLSPRKFPDGAKATKEQMLDAKKIFAQFDKQVEDYRACLKADHEAKLKKNPKADDGLKKEFMTDYKTKDDAAMDENEKAKDSLNAQLAAYKAAHPK